MWCGKADSRSKSELLRLAEEKSEKVIRVGLRAEVVDRVDVWSCNRRLHGVLMSPAPRH